MEEEKFESRVLKNPFDVVAAINHLQDRNEPLQVILTIDDKETKIMVVKEDREILDVNKFLLQNFSIRKVHLAIESLA